MKKIGYIFITITLVLNVASSFFAKLSVTESEMELKLSFVALFLLGTSFITYRKAFKYLPMFIVQSISSLKFMFLIFIAFFYFKEQISLIQWCGVIFIWSGVLLLLKGSKYDK